MKEVERFTFDVQPANLEIGLHLVRAGLLRRRLDFGHESRQFLKDVKPPIVVLGRQYIPASGPCVITPNHLFWPGFQAWWLAAAISSVTPASIHWVMSAAWTTPNRWKAWWWTPLTTSVFKKIAEVYGFTTMPPMPPDPKQVAWRAKSVRAILRYVHEQLDEQFGKGILIGLAPEGHDMPDGKIHMPPKGVGRFVGQMVSLGLSIIPVGVFIMERQLCLNFGAPYQPEFDQRLKKDRLDEMISCQVMSHIASLVPESFRGEFL